MKVGILTYHDTNNYGAQLQAASVQRFLASMSVDAELVDFRPYRHVIRRNMTLARAIYRRNPRAFKREHERNMLFRNAIFDMAKVSAKSTFFAREIPGLCAPYDALVCGSDELWNFGNYRGYMAPYILDFPVRAGVRKVSYAASIGSYVPPADVREKMKSALAAFSQILVRDPTTEAFVRDLGLDATRVVDPTFLVDLAPIVPDVGEFMMISGGMSRAQVDRALAAARQLNLRPISVGVAYPGHEDIYVRATPREWIGYVKAATCHVTSLFHGAALSLKYETPFSVFLTLGKEQKILSLLDWMGEGGRMVAADADAATIAAVASTPLSPELGAIRDQRVAASQAAFMAALTGA
ncbi:MAG: polysaccharide pyruvyl transferase family protein [Rhizobium sp.]|nr:polysaccharide pyruvyl transferase family protein [Rhizobium sp.]